MQQCATVVMDTAVTLRAITTDVEEFAVRAERAFDWFRTVERHCSRFDPASDVRQLTRHPGEAVSVTPLLFQAVQFALTVAELTDGAFDPTVGQTLERLGFDRHYLTGARTATGLPDDGMPPSYADVVLDDDRRTIMLLRPLILDLGAVVKGLAIDLAAKELAPLGNFSIDAGGDIYVAGLNDANEAWRVGIRHPRQPESVAAILRVSDLAVCTSGDYERPAAGGHHIVDPYTRQSPSDVASVTVVAPNAMLADALSTAVFVLGPQRGLRLLDSQGLNGLLLSPTLESWMTPGLERYLA